MEAEGRPGEQLGREPDPFTTLLERAESDPAGAVAGWIELFEKDADGGLGVLLTHERGLTRLLQVALRHATEADPGLPTLAAQARSLVNAALASRPAATSPEAPPDDAIEPVLPVGEQLAGSLGEAFDLNRESEKWRGTGGLQWAIKGITALQGGQDTAPPGLPAPSPLSPRQVHRAGGGSAA